MLLALLGRIALDRAGQAAGTAAATADFAAWHLDHLDAVLAQHSVDGDVAVVAQDDAGGDREVVVPVVPLSRSAARMSSSETLADTLGYPATSSAGLPALAPRAP